jgi:hypothetical protein
LAGSELANVFIVLGLSPAVAPNVTQAPNQGHYLPKQDKFVEWTLFQILEQLKELNKHMALLAMKSSLSH